MSNFCSFVLFSLQGLTVQDLSWPGPLNGCKRPEFDQIWCADVCMHISSTLRAEITCSSSIAHKSCLVRHILYSCVKSLHLNMLYTRTYTLVPLIKQV